MTGNFRSFSLQFRYVSSLTFHALRTNTGRILSPINKYVFASIYAFSSPTYWHFLLCLIVHFPISLVPSATLAKATLITPLTRWDTVNRNVTNACIVYWIIVEYQRLKLFEIITNWLTFLSEKKYRKYKNTCRKNIRNFLAIYSRYLL